MIRTMRWVARATHILFQGTIRLRTVKSYAQIQLDTDLIVYDHTTLSNIKGFTRRRHTGNC